MERAEQQVDIVSLRDQGYRGLIPYQPGSPPGLHLLHIWVVRNGRYVPRSRFSLRLDQEVLMPAIDSEQAPDNLLGIASGPAQRRKTSERDPNSQPVVPVQRYISRACAASAPDVRLRVGDGGLA